MSRTQIIKKVAIILCSIAGTVVLALAAFFFNMLNVMPYDYAWRLSDKVETIDAFHVKWGCDCVDFTFCGTEDIFTAPDADFFFIEAADSTMIPHKAYYDSGYLNQCLRLTGRFYIDQGISRQYENKTPEKPEHARVFRYDKIEYVLNTK